MNNVVEKQIEIAAPISRVWRALSDHREFGEWFRVALDGPFVAGQWARGRVTYPGYEHLKWEALIEKIEPETYMSLKWHPYAIDPNTDYSNEAPTLVEFRLQPTQNGTLLTVTESGFDNIPPHRRMEALRMNEGGWAEQVKNIQQHVTESR
jgi:uncharacterized protein YndB with AHSA1/START domain